MFYEENASDDDIYYTEVAKGITDFERYFKMRQLLLQTATGITNCDDCYYKLRQVLQIATLQTNHGEIWVHGCPYTISEILI